MKHLFHGFWHHRERYAMYSISEWKWKWDMSIVFLLLWTIMISAVIIWIVVFKIYTGKVSIPEHAYVPENIKVQE